jgi:hypothetical protein
MLFPLSSLKPFVARRVSFFEREMVTAVETSGVLLDRFAFALLDFPSEQPAVNEVLDAVPPVLISGMSARLTRCRIANGGWHWPPGGMGIPNPGPTPPWGVADSTEADALDALAGWLQARAVLYFTRPGVRRSRTPGI